MASKLIRSFEIPSKFYCTVGNTEVIKVFNDKITLGEFEFLFKNIIAVRPSKERDGFIMELEDAIYNPIMKEKNITMHILKRGLFGFAAAKKYGMEIYTIFYDALCNKK